MANSLLTLANGGLRPLTSSLQALAGLQILALTTLGTPIFSRSLTVDYTQVSTNDQLNFAVLVSVADVGLKSIAHGGHVHDDVNGYDILFASDAGITSLLNWEVESYDSTNGILVAWVKIPTLSHTTNTVFYMQYGNPAIVSFQGGTASTVWDANYLGVYHLGAGLNVNDSKGLHNGTNHGATASTSGRIDGCGSFVAANSQYIDLASDMNPTAITYSAWIKATSYPGTYTAIVGRRAGGNYSLLGTTGGSGLTVFMATTGGNSSYVGGPHVLSTGVWYYVTAVYSSAVGLIGYVNAASDGAGVANGALLTGAGQTEIGNDIGGVGLRFWDGLIDEVRISNIARSIDWITTEYNNQKSGSTFVSLGTE